MQAAARSRPLLAGDLHVALLASDGHNAAGRRGSVRAGYADAKRDLEGDAGEATAHRRGPQERTAGISDQALWSRRSAALLRPTQSPSRIHFLFAKSRLNIPHRLFSLSSMSRLLQQLIRLIALPPRSMSRFTFPTGEAISTETIVNDADTQALF